MKTEIYHNTIINSYYLSYLVNNDPSSLNDKEIDKCNAWSADNMVLSVCPKGESYFYHRNDIDGYIGCDVTDCDLICLPTD